MNLILSKKEKEVKNQHLWLVNIFIFIIAIFLAFFTAVKYYNLV